MALRDRTITFAGTNIKSLGKVLYSSFKEQTPQPKIFKVDIPAGRDLDITDSLGRLGFHDGVHTITFLVYGENDAERLHTVQLIMALFHGRLREYTLSWRPERTYTGRALVSIDHRSENADLVTIEISYKPYSEGVREHIEVIVPNNSDGTATWAFSGSMRYGNVWVTFPQNGTMYIGGSVGKTFTIEGNPQPQKVIDDIYGYTRVNIRLADWLMYIDANSNLVVNQKYSGSLSSGGNQVINSTYSITSGNMKFDKEAEQHVTIHFTRMDM